MPTGKFHTTPLKRAEIELAHFQNPGVSKGLQVHREASHDSAKTRGDRAQPPAVDGF